MDLAGLGPAAGSATVRPAPLTTRSRRGWAAACLLVLAVSAGVSLRHLAGPHPLLTAIAIVVGLGLTIGGLSMASGGRGTGTGLAVALCGAIWPLDWWPLTAHTGPGALLAWLCGGARWIALVYAGVSHPTDVVRGRRERQVLWAAAITFGPGNLLLALTSRPEWNGFSAQAWWPYLGTDRWVHQVGALLYGGACLVIAVIGVITVSGRLASWARVDRLVLQPALYGMLAAGVIAVGAKTFQTFAHSERGWTVYVVATGLGMLAIPGSLAASELTFWSARLAVAETITRLSHPASPEAVRQALATALRDDSIEVFLWSAEHRDLLPLPDTRADDDPTDDRRWAGRTVIPVRNPDGSLLACITTDPRLEIYPQMLEAAVSAAQTPLENAQMAANLEAALEETRRSRTRIFEAQVAERRRLERDLHDGVQQRLLGLTLRLAELRIRTAEPHTAALATELKTGLLSAVEEIRTLGRGLHPTALQQSGVAAALADVAAPLSLRTDLDVRLPRLAPPQESAVYFIVSEALTNTAKHADAEHAWVRARIRGDQVDLRVSDDGRGGARPGEEGGLRGIHDRVAALNGIVEVTSTAQDGTTIDVTFPASRAPDPGVDHSGGVGSGGGSSLGSSGAEEQDPGDQGQGTGLPLR